MGEHFGEKRRRSRFGELSTGFPQVKVDNFEVIDSYSPVLHENGF
jgi:hypothetical protein